MTTLDIREIEAGIRAAYKKLDLAAKARYRNPANWEGRNGAQVSLADLREALPAEWGKEQVDQALGLLCDHADVHMYPLSDQKNAAMRDAEAAVFVGATHHHAIQIDRRSPEPERVVERLRMRERDYAESQVAALDDHTVAQVAEQMGVEPDPDPNVLRQRLIDTSVANLDTWRADAQQGQDDGMLLYRADNEPEWVASWTDDDRQQAAEAAARLQERAVTDPHWAFVKDRADRWAAGPAPAKDVTPEPVDSRTDDVIDIDTDEDADEADGLDP